ncbi:MAG: PHP domain-containing protein, partial [Actinomycetia bacterium]|nr:PHP domain-containing protein [Actinomycetes bacterium]
NVEIIIAGKRTWSWQLFKTTGSRKHLFKLKEYAKANSIPYPDRTASADLNSEEDIYRSLGLDHIAVELRQGRDEIELSLENRLPDLVKMDDIKGDLHIHSKWSDGLIEYSDIINTAKKQNYEYIAISDHSISSYYGNGLDIERLIKKMDFIKELRKEHDDIDILMGAEIDVRKPGVFDYPPDIIKKLDIAIASLHSSFANSTEENTARAVSALEKDYFDLLAHPGGSVFGNRAPLFIDIDRIIEASAKYGRALEINSYYMRLDLDEDNAIKAKEAGSMLSINTDSHRPGNMEMMQLGVDLARRAGLEAKDIINAMTAEELKIWRKDRARASRLSQ